MSWSDRTTYQGKACNEGTKALMKAANILVRSATFGAETSDITWAQGGYNKGGVAASAGTHDGGGAFDTTPYNWQNRVKVFRILGVAMWHRPTITGLWSAHCHGIVCGDGTASAGAKAQVAEYYAGGDGLAGSAKDPNWRPKQLPILFHLPAGTDLAVRYAKADAAMFDQPSTSGADKGWLRKDQKFTPVAMVKAGTVSWLINRDGKCVKDALVTKTAPTTVTPPAPTPAPVPTVKSRIRMGQYNLPGPDKHANADARAKRAAALVKAARLDVLTTNELVGTGVDSTTSAGSAFARALHGYLGTADWGMVVPTTAYNENYIFYRKGGVALKQRFADAKIYAAGVPGRHVTRAMLTDRDAGKDFAVGATHLVNDNELGALLQAPLVWNAMAAVKGTAPAFVFGDMNTEKILPGFTNAGLRNARLAAVASTNKTASTYVGWSDTTPDYDPNWIIDQLYVPPTFTVDGYTVVLDTNTAGTFNTPKPSDHLMVIIAVTEE